MTVGAPLLQSISHMGSGPDVRSEADFDRFESHPDVVAGLVPLTPNVGAPNKPNRGGPDKPNPYFAALIPGYIGPGYSSPRSRRSFAQYSSRFLISRSKPRSGGS
jgi:hypothetical protein